MHVRNSEVRTYDLLRKSVLRSFRMRKARLDVSRNRAKQEQIKSASGGPPGAFATWQAAGGKAPPATSPGVGVVPGRQGQAAARSRQAASLDPIPPTVPLKPLRGPLARFSVKGGSRGWCGPQPRRGRGHGPLTRPGAQACRQGVGALFPGTPAPRRRPPAGRRKAYGSMRCRGHPLPGVQGARSPWAAQRTKPSAEGEHFLLFELRFWLFKRPQRGLIYRYRRGRGES